MSQKWKKYSSFYKSFGCQGPGLDSVSAILHIQQSWPWTYFFLSSKIPATSLVLGHGGSLHHTVPWNSKEQHPLMPSCTIPVTDSYLPSNSKKRNTKASEPVLLHFICMAVFSPSNNLLEILILLWLLGTFFYLLNICMTVSWLQHLYNKSDIMDIIFLRLFREM